MHQYVGRHCDLHTETEPNNPVITCNLFVLIMLPLDNLGMEASNQKSSRKLLLTVLSSKDSDRLQGPNKCLIRLFFSPSTITLLSYYVSTGKKKTKQKDIIQ